MRIQNSFHDDPVLAKARQQSNFRAVKDLVEADNHLRLAENRIKVLNSSHNKNALKIANQMAVIHKIQQVRQATHSHNQMIEAVQGELQAQAEVVKVKNKQMTLQQKEKMKEVVESIQKSKKETYLRVEQNSNACEKKILQMRQQEQQTKDLQRQKVQAEQIRGKESRILHEDMKQQRFKVSKQNQIAGIKHQEKKKQRQLQNLNNREMMLIQQQAESQSAYLKVKDQLDQLLHQAKIQHRTAKRSMKSSIHYQQSPLNS